MQVKGLKIDGISPASTPQNSSPKKLQPQDDDAVSINLRRAKPSAASTKISQAGGENNPIGGDNGGEVS